PPGRAQPDRPVADHLRPGRARRADRDHEPDRAEGGPRAATGGPDARGDPDRRARDAQPAGRPTWRPAGAGGHRDADGPEPGAGATVPQARRAGEDTGAKPAEGVLRENEGSLRR